MITTIVILGGKFSDTGDIWAGPPVISGHIHQRQFLRDNELVIPFSTLTENCVYYPGSAFQHNFGNPGPFVVTMLDTETLTIKEHNLKLPLRKTFHIKSAKQYKDVMENYDKSKYIDTKVKLRMSEEEFKAFKKTPDYINSEVKIVWEKPRHDLIKKMKELGLDSSAGVRDIVLKKITEELRPLFEEIEEIKS